MEAYKKETWWTEFFKGSYSEVVLNQQPMETLAFMNKVGDIRPNMKAFDQCCGKGTLSHELDKAGLYVTGIDMSEEYINHANNTFASDRAVFQQEDAKKYIQPEAFDIAINWNTSFAYNEDDAENEKMLIAFSASLRQGGQFFLCTMNPLFIHRHFQRFIVKYVPYGDSTIVTIRESRIDNDMMTSDWLIIYPDGHRETAYGQTKLYTLEQFRDMFARHGLTIEKVYGDINLAPYDEDHPSLIIYGHKQS